MPLFRNVTTHVLEMQFGRDPKIVIEPGEVAEVPERWEGLVAARGYHVERVDEGTAFDELASNASSIVEPLVPAVSADEVAKRFEVFLASLRVAPSREAMNTLFEGSKELADLLTDEQRQLAHEVANYRAYAENFGQPKPADGEGEKGPASGDADDEQEPADGDATSADGEASKPKRSRKKKPAEGEGEKDAG